MHLATFCTGETESMHGEPRFDKALSLSAPGVTEVLRDQELRLAVF
jgi:hypothetical protein